MSAFKCSLRQRVWVPQLDKVQAVITARVEDARGEPSYELRWTEPNGHGAIAWFLQSELLAANPAEQLAAKAKRRARR